MFSSSCADPLVKISTHKPSIIVQVTTLCLVRGGLPGVHPELAAGVGHGDVTHCLLHHARPRARPRDCRQEAEAVIVTRADVVNRLRPRPWRRLVII